MAIVAPPQGVSVGWDAADALAAGWNEQRAAEFIAAAVPFDDAPGQRHRRARARDDVIGAVLNTEGVELWRDPSGATYATVPIQRHVENWSLRAYGFERWLSGLYYQKTGVALPSQALDDIRRTFEIKAYSEGATYEPFCRVGSQNGKLFLDLCDDEWRAVEIAAKGWRVVERPPVEFVALGIGTSVAGTARRRRHRTLARFRQCCQRGRFQIDRLRSCCRVAAWQSVPDPDHQWHSRDRQKRAVPRAAVAD